MLYHQHILMGWLAILLYSICTVAIPCQVEELSKWKTALKLKTNSPTFGLNELPGGMIKCGYLCLPWIPDKNGLWKSLYKGGEINCSCYFTHWFSKYFFGVLGSLFFFLIHSVPSWEYKRKVMTLCISIQRTFCPAFKTSLVCLPLPKIQGWKQ